MLMSLFSSPLCFTRHYAFIAALPLISYAADFFFAATMPLTPPLSVYVATILLDCFR